MLASVMFGQHNLCQPIEQDIGGDVVWIESHLNENLCNPKIVRRGVENAV